MRSPAGTSTKPGPRNTRGRRLNAEGNDVAIELLELAYEGMKRKK